MIPRLISPLLRLCGVDPPRTWALVMGLRGEGRGQMAIQYEEKGKKGLHPDTGRIVLLVMLGLFSVGVAVGVAAMRGRLDVAVSIMVFAQGVAVFMRAGGEIVPVVLGTDDRRVLGWWPVSEREILVARGVLVLESVLEASAAILAIPLVVLLVVGRPPVTPLLGALVGVLLHAITLAAVMLLLVHGIGRLLGRQRARRVIDVMSSIFIIIAINLIIRTVRPSLETLGELSPWVLTAVPTYWYGAWGALHAPSGPMLAAVTAGLAATIVLLGGGVRVLAGRNTAADEEEQTSARGGRDWTRPILAWLSPWLRGRDGRVMLLLLKSQLREDWRFTSSVMFLPAGLLVYLFVIRVDDMGELMRDLTSARDLASTMGLWMSFLAVSVAGSIVLSVQADAAWLVQGGVLDARRMLSMQRRLMRWLIPIPLMAVLMTVLVVRIGFDVRQVPLVAIPALLAFEIMVVFLQCAAPSMPFCRAWRREGHQFRGFHLLALVVWPLAFGPVVLGFLWMPWGPPLAMLGQLAVLGVLRLVLRWRVSRTDVTGHAPRP